MPRADSSASILSASAGYQAGDWAAVQGGGSLDFRAAAELKRGLNLELGAQALVSLDATFSKFLAVDLQGQANAAARVQAQVQVPLDLFAEAGLAIRLQAVAEAAVGVELAIGLSIGDFIELASADPRIRGIGVRLLMALLDNTTIAGGVRAKAAASAMAYANLAATGRLIDTPQGKPGFLIAAEAGLGLKAGAGFRVFARFDVGEPGQLVRRLVDVVVDETLVRISDLLSDPGQVVLVDELRAPAKIALRTCFELGSELARNGGVFNAAAGPVMAQRLSQVFLEEAQRYLLEKLTDLGTDLYKDALRAMGFNESAWDVAQGERQTFATRLRAMPDDPFDPTNENKAYWSGVIADAVALAVALGSQNRHSEPWVEPLAVVWSAAQLQFVAVERISTGSARATLLNASANTTFTPFTGAAPQPAPPLIRDCINAAVRPGASPRTPTLEDLVAFLLRAAVVDPLAARVPSIRGVVDIVGGTGAAPAAAIATIFNNLGAFVPRSGGGVDPQQSVTVLLAGLQAFIDTRLRGSLEPALREALADEDPELQLYLDEVLLASLGFVTGEVFTRARQWSSGNQSVQTALREACSALLMKVLGRSLVVTMDVLLDKSLRALGGELHAAGAQLNQAGGVVDRLAAMVPIDRSALHDAVAEIFDLAGDTFAPLAPEKRARLRDLLYQVMDTAPAGEEAGLVTTLQNEAFMPNGEAAAALALELGGLIADNFVRLITRILELLAEEILRILAAFVEAIEQQIAQWVAGLQALVDDIARTIQGVLLEIAALQQQVEAAADRLLDQTEAFLGLLAASGQRGRLRDTVRAAVRDTCVGVLGDVPGYSLLPSSARRLVRDTLDDVLRDLLGQAIFDGMFEAIGTIADGLEDFLHDARNIDPDDDVAGALVELLVDRLEDAIRDAFGGSIRIDIAFRARGTFRGPRIDTPFGSYRPSLTLDFDVDLGDVRIDVDDIVGVLRAAARAVQAVTSGAHNLADVLAEAIGLEQQLDARELERDNMQTQSTDASRKVQETTASAASIRIVQPGAASAYSGDVPIEIALMGVPAGFLGGEGEAPRVLVFLNEEPLDLARFDVAFGLTGIRPGGLPAGGVLAGGPPGALQRLTMSTRQSHPVTGLRSTLRSRSRASGWASAKQAAAEDRTRRPEAAMTGLGRGGGVRGKPSAPPPPQFTVGRKPRLSVADRLTAAVVPDLTLRATLTSGELAPDAFNTLTVVVSTGTATQRITESVVFFASGAAVTRPIGGFRPPKGKLPTRAQVDPALLDPILKGALAAGGGRKATKGPPPRPEKPPPPSATLRPRPTPERKRAIEAARKAVHGVIETHVGRVVATRDHVRERVLGRSLDASIRPKLPRREELA